MKIVKRGQPPEDRVWVGSCHYCGTEIECEQREIEAARERCPREHYEFARVACPVCGRPMIAYPRTRKGSGNPH